MNGWNARRNALQVLLSQPESCRPWPAVMSRDPSMDVGAVRIGRQAAPATDRTELPGAKRSFGPCDSFNLA